MRSSNLPKVANLLLMSMFFGTLNGSGSYYDPGTLVSNNSFVAPGKNFYYTNAIN